MPLKLSILVPVYNEAATVEQLIHRLSEVRFPIEREIIAVDDGSTDGSDRILRELERAGRLRLSVHAWNQGKGAAVQTATQLAQGQILVVQDADLELNPEDLPTLLAPILAGETQVCFGSRFLDGRKASRMGVPAYWGNRILNRLSNLLNGISITDFNTCYKMLTREAASRLELHERGFTLEPEITTKLARLGYTILERPIRYEPRGIRDGKKIRWTDFFRYVAAMIRYRYFWSPAASPLPNFVPTALARSG